MELYSTVWLCCGINHNYMNHIISPIGEVKNRDNSLGQKNVLALIRDASITVEEKIIQDRKYYQQKKVAAKNFDRIAGIDPTMGGKRLTYQQAVDHEKRVKEDFTQREALKKALEGFQMYLLPKEIFYRIRAKLGLFAIEASPYNNWYISQSTGSPQTPEAIKVSDRITLLVFILAVGIIPYAILKYSASNDPIFTYVVKPFLAGTFIYLAVNVIQYLRIMWRERNTLAYHFPSMIISNDDTDMPYGVTIRKLVENRIRTMVQIDLIQPEDEAIVNTMGKVSIAVPKEDEWTIWTVADPKCIGFSVQEKVEPEPIKEPEPADPGLVVQYKGYVAVLPETWYNVTELEQSFIDEIMAIAERWDARAYLAN